MKGRASPVGIERSRSIGNQTGKGGRLLLFRWTVGWIAREGRVDDSVDYSYPGIAISGKRKGTREGSPPASRTAERGDE